MKKILSFLLPLSVVLACNNSPNTGNTELAENTSSESQIESTMNFHNFKTQTLDGDTFDFSNLKGKRVLIVNTASECGYTPQYEQLQELYDTYGGEDFTVLGFPSNDFGGQEPGSDEDIAAFCKKNFGVSFPMMAKNPVTGSGQQEVYKWLTDKSLNGKDNATVKWNFNKFLIDENGNWIAHKASSVSPLDDEIVKFAEGK